MGIIRSHAELYLAARARGVDFTRTLTLGRQRLYVTASELKSLRARYRPTDTRPLGDLRYGEPADRFLTRFLDVRDLRSLDHSPYEGAALTHDLNQPLPAALHEQFDVVIDSGTLEHVFNLPVAIASCMQLVKRGGTLFLSSPANNMCGHGFYQFSPELFFRLFNGANGFSLTRLVLVTHPFPGAELSSRQTWYEVRDPAEIGARAPLMTRTPAFLMLEARREEIVDVLATPPQQSDYVAKWQSATADSHAATTPAPSSSEARAFRPARAVFTRLPPGLQMFVTGWYQRGILCTLRNRRAFRRLD